MNTIDIAGVSINLDALEFTKVDTIEEIQKLGIFYQFPPDVKLASETVLFDKVKNITPLESDVLLVKTVIKPSGYPKEECKTP